MRNDRKDRSVWEKFNQEMQEKVKWVEVATSLGIEFAEDPSRGGWVKCKAITGDDSNPSASFNVDTGYYKDFRNGKPACSAYDLMVERGITSTFAEARRLIAENFGVKWPGRLDDEKYIERGVMWEKWNDDIAKGYCDVKRPITIDGLKRAGARMCIRYGVECFALPVHNINCQIIGWMFLPRNGLPFESFGGMSGAKSVTKIMEGYKDGYVCGPDTVMAIREGRITPVQQGDKSEYLVFWTEGAPDMLAGLSRFKDHHFLTNSFGCSERITETQAEFWQFKIDGSSILECVIADADIPGIMTPRLTRLWMAVPPYQIDKKHGKDYRDWLCEPDCQAIDTNPVRGCTWMSSADVTEELERHGIVVDRRRPDTELLGSQEGSDQIMIEARRTTAQATLDAIGVRVVNIHPDGAIELYSKRMNSERTFSNLKTVGYEDLVAFLGSHFTMRVARTGKEALMQSSPGCTVIPLNTFKDHIGTIASSMVATNPDQLGCGIWRTLGKDSEATECVTIVTRQKAFHYSRNNGLAELDNPNHYGQIAKIARPYAWFDEKKFEPLINRAVHDPEFRKSSFEAVVNLYRKWNWTDHRMPQLLAGLTVSTLLQSMLTWRPTVGITGKSDCGKSQFVLVFGKLLGDLAFKSSGSTPAGIFQNIGIDSRATIVDEVDSIPGVERLLTTLRSSGRGIANLMGTSNHKGISYRICHLMWLVGIHLEVVKQADSNRTLMFEMNKIITDNQFLDLPGDEAIADIGRNLIACAIAFANQIVELQPQLARRVRQFNKDTRHRESLSVALAPAVALGVMSEQDALEFAAAYGKDVIADQTVDVVDDEERLLQDILAATVKLPREAPVEYATVADILFSDRLELYRNAARNYGIGYVIPRSGDGEIKVAIAGTRVGVKGLRLGDSWTGKKHLNQILKRIPFAIPRDFQQIAGQIALCTSFKWHDLKKWAEKANVPIISNDDVRFQPDSPNSPDGRVVPTSPDAPGSTMSFSDSKPA